MSKTTQTTFENVNSNNKVVSYEKDFVIIRKVNDDDETEEEIYLDNVQIKRINRVINKNNKEDEKN